MSVSAGVATVREKLLKGNIGQTKVHRYWAGKRPGYADEVDDDEDEKVVQQEQEKQEVKQEVTSLVIKDDPRLRRLAETRKNQEESQESRRQRHREIRKAEIVSTEVDEQEELQTQLGSVAIHEDDEVDDDAFGERRRKARELGLQKLKLDEMAMANEAAQGEEQEEDEDDDEEEEEVSEYETDSEEETMGVPMVKPLFVKKAERETIAERERLEAEEYAEQENLKKKLEERKLESQQMVYDVLKKEKEAEKNEPEDFGEDVDTDEENPAEEYESWKTREMARIKREKDAKEAELREKLELEKIRNMDEEQRLEYLKNNPKPAPAPKKKQRYLQKYYHKGAYFQTEDNEKVLPGGTDIYKRDYSQPTGEDKLDKSVLPAVMQVKQFGRSGRTKWKHLVAEDTTQWDSPWTNNDGIRNQYTAKMAGMKPIPGKKRTREQALRN